MRYQFFLPFLSVFVFFFTINQVSKIVIYCTSIVIAGDDVFVIFLFGFSYDSVHVSNKN